ncbi:MAG: hypothetical protein KDK78_09955, partial [Chlamydiia bacterium]|nr:hypothetical protein [Chlamydiia bacterium]
MKAPLLSILTVCALLLGSCASQYSADRSCSLSSITLIDRHGMSETITNAERLKRYQDTDFLKPQTFEKVLRIYGRDEQGGVHSSITSYHPNGQVRQFLRAYNGQAVGPYKEWFANGQQKLDARVVGGLAEIGAGAEATWLFDGLCQAWDEKGNLLAEIPYEKGLQEGTARYYHDNGSLWKETPYAHGRIHGQARVYLADGQLLESAHYVNGDRHGETRRFWTKDRVSSVEIFQAGLLISGSYYDLPGGVIAKVDNGSGQRAVFSRLGVARLEQYQDGRQAGRVSVFNDAGQFVRSYHIKDGVKHGEEVEYYAPRLTAIGSDTEPTPHIAVNWHDGVVTGLSRTWYESGQIESQRELSNNKKQGVCTAWYE